MAEVLVQFDAVVTATDGRRFIPRACGRPAGNVWDGWIEFVPTDTGAPVRTPRETEQPNRNDLVYWAQGLTQVYLEGALARALLEPVVIERERPVEPYFEGPAPPAVRRAPVPAGFTRPVLDPFSVMLQGEDILLRELGALDTSRVRDIVLAYGFSTAERAREATREQLTAAVVAGVRRVRSPATPEQESQPGGY
ncbi:MAG TPA: hypothetical protein VLN49_24680 [Gemmatimonadaceae bacterium]|nr:hypothetical protein [Gemmatimonadaceae bacterium]